MENILYQITTNSDLDEGRGQEIGLNIYFEKYEDALSFVYSKHYQQHYGVMGSKGSKYDIKKIDRNTLIPNIYSNIFEYEEKNCIKISKTEEEIFREKISNMSRQELEELIIKKGFNNDI